MKRLLLCVFVFVGAMLAIDPIKYTEKNLPKNNVQNAIVESLAAGTYKQNFTNVVFETSLTNVVFGGNLTKVTFKGDLDKVIFNGEYKGVVVAPNVQVQNSTNARNQILVVSSKKDKKGNFTIN